MFDILFCGFWKFFVQEVFEKNHNFLYQGVKNQKVGRSCASSKNVKHNFDRTKVFKKQITPMTLTKERYYGLLEELNINKSNNDDFNNGKITDKPLMAAYNVTSKTDGVRTHGYIDEQGELYLFTK